MWGQILQVVSNWPWSTIAAFTAAGAAVSVARSETKERANRLGQEAVVEINTRSIEYHRDILEFFRLIRSHLDGEITTETLNRQVYPTLTSAVLTIDRHLKIARMACNDFRMQIHIATAESHIYALLETVDQPRGSGETAVQARDRLNRILDQGEVHMKAFHTASEAFVSRGFQLYSPRRGIRYRIAQKRWDRSVAAEKRERGIVD